MDLYIFEDNQATIKIIRKGYSPKLRFTLRLFNVDISAIKEVCELEQVHLQYCHTKFRETSRNAAHQQALGQYLAGSGEVTHVVVHVV